MLVGYENTCLRIEQYTAQCMPELVVESPSAKVYAQSIFEGNLGHAPVLLVYFTSPALVKSCKGPTDSRAQNYVPQFNSRPALTCEVPWQRPRKVVRLPQLILLTN